MVKGLSAGLQNDHNNYHFSTILHPKICEKCNKSVHHILREDWMIFEPTGSMSDWSLPSSGFWHHVVWWVGSSILDEYATSIYCTWSRVFVFTHQTTHTTSQKQCKETRVYFKNMFFAITFCCMGKESCKEWMTCQEFAVLIHKIVRTLVCIQ